jgi:hypothetical protein
MFPAVFSFALFFEQHMRDCRASLEHVSLGVRALVNLPRALRGEIAPGARRLEALRFARWFQLVFRP